MSKADFHTQSGKGPAQTRKGKATGQSTGLRSMLSGWLYPIILIALITASVAASWQLQDRSVVQHFEIQSAGFTPEAQILAVSGLETGMAAAEVRPLEVQARIDSLPWIAESSVRLVPGGRVLIGFTEREPVALLIEGSRLMLTDAAGVALDIPEGFAPDLPLLYGFRLPAHGERLPEAQFAPLGSFLAALQQSALAGLLISEVGFHPEEGVIALSRENAVRLVFGTESFAQKIDRWEAFYRQVAPVKGMAAFTRLDFRFENQIVALHS
ncbi:Cell division septal protein FtsQ [Cyclonatronum proteinivorum]|uniref:Cell division septal protein FtsQ n=1 Tax=Cyclonatronum proteinivorum TaxID=1457365 RepID=A0A345UIP7_9BACT|nr:FtsQ-type POTRA domain-containing protein [Cyclonatronum proteinivorum]AXJ00349.1 Cell division septal protein FtsQ [Cyclonatronum proteinivorum]